MQKVELEGCIQLRLRGGQDAKESVFVLMVPSNLMCDRPTQCIRAATGLGPSTPLLPMFALVQSRIANRILPITTAGRAATPLRERHAMGAMGDCCRGPVSIFLQEHAFVCD